MNKLVKSVIGALAAIGVASVAVSASAEIVCNDDNVCWHVHHHYVYHPDFGVVVHPDDWTWPPDERYVWKEHPGRGYWREGVWVTF